MNTFTLVSLALAASLLSISYAQADFQAASGNSSQTVSAALDFRINMGKFLFLRIGTGAYPTASNTIDTVALTGRYSIPPNPAIINSNGNNQATNWSGTAPIFSITSPVTLPVEVRSNAGPVSLRASIASPLSNGTDTLPFSGLIISSNNANLPAPSVPDTGSGPSVTVTPGSFAGLVTQRSAQWTFTYNTALPVSAGSYQGQLLFTASAP